MSTQRLCASGLQERIRPLRACEFNAAEFGDIEPDEPLGSFSLLRGQLTLGDDARYQLLLRSHRLAHGPMPPCHMPEK